MSAAFAVVIALGVDFFFGWVQAHSTVAQECHKLGKFYVGHEVFECRKIEGGK